MGVTEDSTTVLNGAKGEAEYSKHRKLAFITIAVCLAVFCTSLDNTIIATAIPQITDQLQTLSHIGWVSFSFEYHVFWD